MALLLVADDQPQEADRLEFLLEQEGHRCVKVRDGAEAVRRFTADHHDLVIMDIEMPGMNGIKATQRVKQACTVDDKYVPVLVVTGADAGRGRAAAYEAGADDFLLKPVEGWELRARVRTFLTIAAQQRATREAYRKLQDLQTFRDELTELLVHDSKNPLACLSSNLTFVESRLREDHDGREAIADCRDSTSRLLRMVMMLLDINKLEEGKLEPQRAIASGLSLLETGARARAHEAGFRGLGVEVEGDSSLGCPMDSDLLGRVIDNLLDNALRYTPRGGLVRLRVERGPLGVRLAVFNSGTAIPPADRDRIFQKYEQLAFTLEPRGANRGLGLYFCRLAVEAHGGSIAIDDIAGEGVRFVIDLPA